MSWQAYIDDHLMCELPGGGQLAHAAICGHDGAVWAQSEDFPAISEAEILALVRGFEDPGQLAAAGIKVGGETYMMVAGEPGEVIRGKKGPGAPPATASGRQWPPPAGPAPPTAARPAAPCSAYAPSTPRPPPSLGDTQHRRADCQEDDWRGGCGHLRRGRDARRVQRGRREPGRLPQGPGEERVGLRGCVEVCGRGGGPGRLPRAPGERTHPLCV